MTEANEVLDIEQEPPIQTVSYKPELLVIGVDALSSKFFDTHLRGSSTWQWLYQAIDNEDAYKHTLHSYGYINEHGERLDPEQHPPHTGPEWTNMYTGVTPENHGIHNGGWRTGEFDFNDVKTRTVFQQIDQAGYTQGVFSMPVTWPAVEIDNGYCISGFPSNYDSEIACSIGDAAENAALDIWNICRQPRNLIDVKEELPVPSDKGLARWEAATTSEEYEEVVQKNMDLELQKMRNAFKLQNTVGADVFWYGTHMIDKAGHIEGLDPGGSMTQTSYTTMGHVCKGLIEVFDPDHWMIVSDHGFDEGGEKQHDHEGVLITDYDFSDTEFGMYDRLETQDVAWLISDILGLGNDWIGRDKE